MRTFYHTDKKCIVDERGWFVSKTTSLDPRVERDGYFFTKTDEEQEYYEYLMSKEEEKEKIRTHHQIRC